MYIVYNDLYTLIYDLYTLEMLAVLRPRLSCMSMLTRVWLTKLHTVGLVLVCPVF